MVTPKSKFDPGVELAEEIKTFLLSASPNLRTRLYVRPKTEMIWVIGGEFRIARLRRIILRVYTVDVDVLEQSNIKRVMEERVSEIIKGDLFSRCVAQIKFEK